MNCSPLTSFLSSGPQHHGSFVTGGHGEHIKPQRPQAKQVILTLSLTNTMIFHTGPTKPALVLLCCIGIWLAICSSSFGAPTGKKIKTILELLKHDSKELYENYRKPPAAGVTAGVAAGVTIDESLQLPCFTLGCEASTNISIIQAYLETVGMLNKNITNTANVIKRLDDIRCADIGCPNPPKLSISGPKDLYKLKSFTLTVFKRLSDCMAELKAKDNIC
ncbi:hypothetical protein STEG23_007864 [Scotinomys teguina]